MSSVSPTHVFGWKIAAQQPVWDAPMFQTLPELLYLGSAILIAISITGAYASSRTLMARLAPTGMEGEFFGLYSLSGAATLWLGSWLIEYFTALFSNQQAGLASTGFLLAAGLFLMLFVKQPARLPGGTY
jgi:UMF1 family MFS transporter